MTQAPAQVPAPSSTPTASASGPAASSRLAPGCRTDLDRWAKQWRTDRARGIKRLIDAGEVAKHLQVLEGRDWSARAIAGACDTSASVIIKIRDGEQKLVKRETARKILAIDPDELPWRPSAATTEPFVSKVGAVRRIQAMLFMGWTHADLQRRCGIRTSVILSQKGRWVTRSTHDKIAALYSEIAMTPGPSARTAGRARKLGYQGPMSWDDIDTDTAPDLGQEDELVEADQTGADETADDELADGAGEEYLDEIAIQRRLDGDKSVRLTVAEKVELKRRWVATGQSLAEMERRTGVNPHRHYTKKSKTADTAAPDDDQAEKLSEDLSEDLGDALDAEALEDLDDQAS